MVSIIIKWTGDKRKRTKLNLGRTILDYYDSRDCVIPTLRPGHVFPSPLGVEKHSNFRTHTNYYRHIDLLSTEHYHKEMNMRYQELGVD